jgi:hypothetical protein
MEPNQFSRSLKINLDWLGLGCMEIKIECKKGLELRRRGRSNV